LASFNDILSRKSLFKDVSVLSPHYVPGELLFRDSQIREIMETLAPALKGQKPKNLFIYGKTGTGKTCSVKHVMDKFNEYDVKTNNTPTPESAIKLPAGSNSPPESAMMYINCRIYHSRYRILQKIMKQFIPELDKAGFGLPFLYEKLVEEIGKGKQMIIILDEIDMVKDIDDLVYTLTRSNDETKGKGGISLVGISNKIHFKTALDPRSKSSLYESEMNFPVYTAVQLQQILNQRISLGYEPNSVETSAVNLAAAITGSETGDARQALKLITIAGEIAQQKGDAKVTDEHVELARKKVELDLAAETISQLPDNLKYVLYAIAHITKNGSRWSRLEGMEEGFLFSGEIYDEYAHVCNQLKKKPRSPRWVKEYVKDLEMLGIVVTTPSGKGVRGQTTLVKLGYPATDMLELMRPTLNLPESS
jgi:cell division control protein 6